MKALFTTLPLPLTAGMFGLIGLWVGNALFRWVVRMTSDETDEEPSLPARFLPLIGPFLSPRARRYCGVSVFPWGTVMELATAVLFVGFLVAKLRFHCQDVTEVRPDEIWRYGRIVYHLVLITLLIAATGTDFRDYVIPDRIVIPGLLIGITGAVISGDLQTIHLWVDWNQEIPGYQGAFIPQWIKDHHHLHGLAWSLAGAAAGAGLTWLVRALSSWMLGQEALGFGDVTLMAMIGSFLGWQPVLAVLVLAPFCGLLVAAFVRMFAGRIIVPYGPFLAAATLIVLFGWRWLWTFEADTGLREPLSVRRLFGDWVAVLILAGIAFAALLVLLTLLRLYRSVPVRKNRARARGDFE